MRQRSIFYSTYVLYANGLTQRKAIESPPRSWERKRPREASTSPESDSNGDGPMDETTEGNVACVRSNSPMDLDSEGGPGELEQWSGVEMIKDCMPASHMEIDVESNTAFVCRQQIQIIKCNKSLVTCSSTKQNISMIWKMQDNLAKWIPQYRFGQLH
ncbi:hypothetical protein A0H81_06549 [Grifola frondosa]|uniref:Uncharacterized protein n=1 Tax=Grifola frondosa TaxID=5627 RepID=A0A1C7M9M2_GRIFR|nr:hypothetical protein A0H81_06549 [Grifola frondosa]